MRSANSRSIAGVSRGLWQQQVQVSCGQWRREDWSGVARSAGSWESVTVTWSAVPGFGGRPPLVQRALAATAQAIIPAITPVIAEVVAARSGRFLRRQVGALIGSNRGPRIVFQSHSRQLPGAGSELRGEALVSLLTWPARTGAVAATASGAPRRAV